MTGPRVCVRTRVGGADQGSPALVPLAARKGPAEEVCALGVGGVPGLRSRPQGCFLGGVCSSDPALNLLLGLRRWRGGRVGLGDSALMGPGGSERSCRGLPSVVQC